MNMAIREVKKGGESLMVGIITKPKTLFHLLANIYHNHFIDCLTFSAVSFSVTSLWNLQYIIV